MLSWTFDTRTRQPQVPSRSPRNKICIVLYNGQNEELHSEIDVWDAGKKEYGVSCAVVEPVYLERSKNNEDDFEWYVKRINTSTMSEWLSYLEMLKKYSIDILCKSGN